MNDKIKRLYDALRADGGDVGSEQEFENWFQTPGEQGYRNRKYVYDTFKADGADIGESYEEFADWLGLQPRKRQQAVSPTPRQHPLDSVDAVNGYVFTEEGLDSAFNQGYPVRAGAGADTPQKGKRPDATSYGIPYRPDTELTAAQRDEIGRQNSYATRQVSKMREQRENEQRRRNQPVVDTGDENVNNHIIKTQGQWEDELTRGVGELGRKYVSPMIGNALKRAEDEWFASMAESGSYPMGEGGELFALRRANERIDPDKILKGLQQSLEDAYSNPEMLKDIGERADAVGIPMDEYLRQVVIPSLQDQLVSEFASSQIARYMPKNTAEYILQGMSNSIGGMLMDAAAETEAQRRYKNEAAAMTEEGLNPHYTPGTGAKLAQMGVSFAADAPFFGFYGKVGGNVAKGLAERQIRKLTAKGLSEGAARSIVGTALENSVGRRMKNYIMQHVVSSSITMGGYNATSETARQVRDREFSPGQIIGSTAEGLATGAAFGLTGGAVQALSQPLSGIARIGSKVGGYLTEGETMYATEELAKMVHGEEGFTNPFEGSAEAMMKLGVMKASGGHLLGKAAEKISRAKEVGARQAALETITGILGRQQTGVRFTPEEEAYVRNSTEGKSLLDALSQMHPEVATTEVRGKRRLTAEGEKMRQELAERYNAFMGNTEIPYAVKAKVAGALGGLMPDAAHTPLETGADIIHNADGSVILKTRDKDGNCMQELRFDSFSEADNWREEHEGDFRLNDAVNMWNGAAPEARANTIRQLMEEYGVGADEAVSMIKSALGGSMGKDFANDQLLYVYDAVRNNAYPADEPNTRRNYWEGQMLTPQERHQAMVEAQQAEDRLTYMGQSFADEVIGAADFPDLKIAELAGRDEITGEQLQAAIDYYNKVSKYSGMMENALQGVDDKVEAANAFVRRNTHKESGSVVEVESDGRGYYLTAGKLALNQDGSLNLRESGDVMILHDKDTGEIQVVSPTKLHITALSDPQRMIADNESMEGLRGRLMQEAEDTIELAPGTPEAPQEAGELFTGADGKTYMVNAESDEVGNVIWSKVEVAVDENGEPTDIAGEPQPLDIEEYRKAKSNEIDAERTSGGIKEKVDEIKGQENGQIMSENAVNTASEVTQQSDYEHDSKGQINGQNSGQNEIEKEKKSASVRIPVDEKGRQQFELARPEDTVAELTERYGEEKARRMIATMAANTRRAYDELSQKDTSKITDMSELAAHEDALAEAERKMRYWEDLTPKEAPAIETEPVGKQDDTAPQQVIRAEKPAEPQPSTVEPQQSTAEPQQSTAEPQQSTAEPQQSTAEQKVAEGTVKNNIGKHFGFQNQDGTRSEITIERMADEGTVEVTRQDYDADGSVKGEAYKQSLNMTDVGKSIVNGVLKPVLSANEKLRKVYKFDRFKVGNVPLIDVLTEDELRQVLSAYERGDKEAVGNLVGDLREAHDGDIIMKSREIRNANVSRIMEGNGSREEKLRRVRDEYKNYDAATAMLEDRALYPADINEWVSELNSRVPKSGEGPLAYFSYDRDGTKVVGMQDETGHGTKTGGDTRGYAPWLAPKGKGVSLAKYAEAIHSQLPEAVQQQYSDQDVRNAILEVFGGAERPSDITTMVIKRGIIQAEQAARRMEEMWIEGGPSFHRVSIDDNTFAGRLARGKQQTNTEPTEKQKEAGNYRKGHVSFGGYDFVIENPEGSMRRGRDAGGNAWEQQMHNTYGYILGKKGKDGDHLDMFINDNADLDNWNGKVYVVDQINADGTLDEHKILYGFGSEAEAREAYLSNYAEGWQGLGRITGVDKNTFDKWLDSSDRKIKAFAEHSIIKDAVKPVETEPQAKVPTSAERDKVLMDAVVDKMREAGIDVSTDWEEGQKVLDEYNGSHELKPMGQKTNKKKAQVAADLEGKELTPEQQAVVDVYTGKKNNAIITFERDGKKRRIVVRKGNERRAGTEHSLFGHYGTTEGVFKSEDILRIPDILANGDRVGVKRGKTQLYEYTLKGEDGIEYTVLTEFKDGRDNFVDFYSSWKIKNKEASSPLASNTPEGAHSFGDDVSSGAKVQQNPESDKKSDEKIRQFKTSDGHAYGFTYKGKIYIDPRIATAETPIHEYGHLWAEMKRQTAPEEWNDIKTALMGDKLVQPIIERVKRDYPELSAEGREDDFVEEVLTQFSGKHGAERLRKIAEEIAAERGGVFGKAEAVTAMQRLKNVLAKFWAGVARMMGWKYRNASEIADKMLLDLMEGVNPRERMKEAGHKQRQFDIVTRENPMLDDYHTGIRKVEDIKTFDEAYNEGRKAAEEGGWKEYASYPDITNELIEDARKSGKITIYSSHPIEDGAFVTPSKMQAKDYAGEGRVYSKRVPLEDVAWLNLDEGQYAKVPEQMNRQKIDYESSEEKQRTENIFSAAKKLFGTTYDIREAGYVLPDGSMPDFSGRHKMKPGIDTRFLRGRRATDHREIESIAYERDQNTKTGIQTDMADFIRRGAIRIDGDAGVINLSVKPTDKQKRILRQLISRNDGYIQLEFGDGSDSGHYVEYDGAKPAKILADIDRYFDEGIKPDSGPKFQRVGYPEPEMTPEDRQYWNQWEAAMRKWKERNAIAADATGPSEKPSLQRGESAVDYAKKLIQWRRENTTWQTAPKLEDYRQARDDKAVQDEARAEEKAYPDSESVRRRRVAADLARLRHAMSRQKAYDKATVKAVTDFAQDFMKMGFGDNLGRGEMERLLSSVKNATGAKDIRRQVDNIMNILIDNQLRNLDLQVVKLSSVKELGKTAQGVEKQGRLELKGQRMIQAFREAREGRMDAGKIRERMGEVAEKMARNDEEAPMWEQEYEGLSIALQYQENIEGSRDEWADLEREYKDAVKEYRQSGRSYRAQQELLESLEQAMTENKVERIGLFGDIIGRLQGNISESMQGAREFVEREKQRVKHIQQIANFDLAGKPADAFREKVKGRPANFFLQPLATFEQMLRLFGSRNASGEGYLYNHFIRNWTDSTDKAYLGEKKAKEELDAKAREVFGNKVKRWSDLYGITRKLPTLKVEVLDGKEKKTLELNQGNLLYIYMADKMTDGRMKLRKMGIDEGTVEKVRDFLDPRLVQLGDWLQDDYLVRKRVEYNKVHERMFGAPMAAIDHYFPIRILSDARYQEQDVSVPEREDALPSTTTRSIIKRTQNTLPLDILHTDALSLAVEHVEDMERWAAMAEWKRDVSTLLSCTTFRNKVKNMKTIYGSGDALWSAFFDTARMAAGEYSPKAKPGSVDSAISNIAKGVTAAKINFRVYTAFKQLLSLPAFFHDVSTSAIVKYMMPQNYFYSNVKWAKENMPVFEKRWKSRQAGDTRLMDDATDWKVWKEGFVKAVTYAGMAPNGWVDGWTCAAGARAIYETRYKKYKGIGASDELAHRRALQDAEIGYNLTQQSSEGAFVSAIQKDRTVAANMLSVFRNSSMAYTRQWVDAARNLRHRMQKGYREDSIMFMARQMQEQFGLDEAQAGKAAEAEYARAGRHDVARMLNMMFGVTVAWNLGASLPYLLIGDDDETKKEMMTDALLKGLLAGPTEGLAAGNIISDMVALGTNESVRKAFGNSLGEGWQQARKNIGDYEINPLPLFADLDKLIGKTGRDGYDAAQDVFNICAQSAVGVNPQTFTDMWNACMDYGAPGWDGTSYTFDAENMSRAKEIALFIMRVMNAPTSSWRNKYIDELGMDAGDAQKLPYEEMARRYAHYKHWKDAPVMGWLRGGEDREAKMEKIRKQFDKAVKERLARADYEALRHELGSTGDEAARKAIVGSMKEQAGSMTDKELLELRTTSGSEDERKAVSDIIRKRAQEFAAGLSDEALADSIGGAKTVERKNEFVSEYARRQGTQDYYGKESSSRAYQELRTYEDVREDIRLSELYRRVKESGDEAARKAIDRLRSRISKQKNALGGDDAANAEMMGNIRQWRREALEKALQAGAGQ